MEEKLELTKKDKAIIWVKRHKVQIGVGALVAAGSIASVAIAVKTGHMPRLGDAHKSTCKGVSSVVETVKKAPLPKVSLTGVEKTATGLGNDLLLSNQQINKRLVSKGMMAKEPWGYELTELGKLFGKETVKVTRYGHAFSNIEWDEAVIPYIFTPDELTGIDATKARITQILAQ